jgi:hypothetical protein
LHFDRASYHVFRVVLLSTALLLTAGQHVSLLCQVWCDPEAAAASGCHDRGNVTDAPRLTSLDSCDDGVASIAAFIREDLRLGASAPQVDHTIPVPRYAVAPTTTDARLLHEPGRLPSPGTSPLNTALRI